MKRIAKGDKALAPGGGNGGNFRSRKACAVCDKEESDDCKLDLCCVNVHGKYCGAHVCADCFDEHCTSSYLAETEAIHIEIDRIRAERALMMCKRDSASVEFSA